MKLKRMYHPILRTEKTAGNEIGIFVVSTYNTDYVLVMFPNVVFIKKHAKYLSIIIVFVVLLCLLCLGMCNWNVMSFLFSPRGI